MANTIYLINLFHDVRSLRKKGRKRDQELRSEGCNFKEEGISDKVVFDQKRSGGKPWG